MSSFITSTSASVCDSIKDSPNPGDSGDVLSNFVSGWVLMDADNNDGYSQAGFLAGYNQTVYVWAQFRRPSDNHLYNRYLAGAVPANTKYAFYEQYLTNCAAPTNHACMESKRGSTRITDTNYDPNTQWVKPWQPQWADEKTHDGSDVMGTTGNHLNYTSMGVQGSGTGYSLVPCILSVTQQASRSTHAAKDCNNVDIWTTTP